MMRTLALVLLLATTLALSIVVGAGCSSSSNGTPTDSPQCTPPPFYQFTVDVQGKGSTAGHIAAGRLLQTGSVLFCTTSLVAGGGTFTLAGVGTAVNPSFELVLNSESGAAWAYGAGDAHWAFNPLLVGQLSGTSCDKDRTWTLPFDAGTAAQSAVTWPLGTRCP